MRGLCSDGGLCARTFLLLNRCGPWTKSRSSEESKSRSSPENTSRSSQESERPSVAVFEAVDRPDIRQDVDTASGRHAQAGAVDSWFKACLNAPRQQLQGLIIGEAGDREGRQESDERSPPSPVIKPYTSFIEGIPKQRTLSGNTCLLFKTKVSALLHVAFPSSFSHKLTTSSHIFLSCLPCIIYIFLLLFLLLGPLSSIFCVVWVFRLCTAREAYCPRLRNVSSFLSFPSIIVSNVCSDVVCTLYLSYVHLPTPLIRTSWG